MKTQFLGICLVLSLFLCASVVESAKHHKRISFRHAALAVKEPVWGLDAGGNVYALNKYNNFVKIPGKTLIYVDVKVFFGQLYVWGIDKFQDVYQRIGENGAWTRFPGKKLVFLRIQSPNRIWGINDVDQVFTANVTTKQWKQISGTLKTLDVQAGGRIWGVNRQNQIFTKGSDGAGLEIIPGGLDKIRVLDNGRVWGIGGNQIFYREGVYGTWVNVPGGLTNFDINNKGDYWGINVNQDVFWRNQIGGGWTYVPGGKFKSLRVTESGKVYAINQNSEIYQNNSPPGGWVRVYGAQLVSLFGPEAKL